jgi:hypothetical protein
VQFEANVESPSDIPDPVPLPWWVVPLSVAFVLIGGALLSAALLLTGWTVVQVAIGVIDAIDSRPIAAVVMIISAPSLAILFVTACGLRFARPRVRALLVTSSVCILVAVAIASLLVPEIPSLSAIIGWVGFCLGCIGATMLQYTELLCDRHHWRRTRLHRRLCPVCGYPITGLPERRCPECGATWSGDEVRSVK